MKQESNEKELDRLNTTPKESSNAYSFVFRVVLKSRISYCKILWNKIEQYFTAMSASFQIKKGLRAFTILKFDLKTNKKLPIFKEINTETFGGKTKQKKTRISIFQ